MLGKFWGGFCQIVRFLDGLKYFYRCSLVVFLGVPFFLIVKGIFERNYDYIGANEKQREKKYIFKCFLR